jgi:hypothetical protein
MAQADATIVSQTELDKKAFAENQIKNFAVDANFLRKPEYFVHMYNVGERSHRISNGLIKNALIPGVKNGERYVKCFSLPNIVNQCWQDPDNGQLRTYGEDGRRVMMDLINPANMGIDQDFELPPDQIVSQGSNLAVWGLFWSAYDPPQEEEIAKAVTRMEKHYRRLLTEADALDRAGKRGDILEIHHTAASYFRYKGTWNTVVEVPTDCPVCGNPMRKGAAFHMFDGGGICVNDWKRTVAAGARTKDQVPDEERWWKPKGTKED